MVDTVQSLDLNGLKHDADLQLWWDDGLLRLWRGSHKRRLYFRMGDTDQFLDIRWKRPSLGSTPDTSWNKVVCLDRGKKFHTVRSDGHLIAALFIEDVDPEDYWQTQPPKERRW